MTEINGNPKGLNRANQEGAEQPSNDIVEGFPEQALPRVAERYHEEDGFDPSESDLPETLFPLSKYSQRLFPNLGVVSNSKIGQIKTILLIYSGWLIC